jgi:hypothetical protein
MNFGMGIREVDKLAIAIKNLLHFNKFSRIIECGTFNGLGSTSRFCEAIHDNPIPFISIEVNPMYHQLAIKNLSYNFLSFTTLINGLTIPRHLLPKKEDIDLSYATYDFIESKDPKECYIQEINFDVPDDILGKIFKDEMEDELIFLDSAGHMGFIEFNYLLSLTKFPKMIILDDINHIKHFKTMQFIKSQPENFKIILTDNDRYGFAIVNYFKLLDRMV